MAWDKKTTIGELYDPAMKITDKEEAKAYFERLVQHCLSLENISREDAERVQRHNLGYFAGYYDHDTRLRVEKLFECTHPIFGAAAYGEPTLEEAFNLGLERGKKLTE